MTSTTAYDAELADNYIAATETDFRRTFIGYTFHAALANVKNQRILDLGCGDGRDAALIRGRGAAYVLGIDSSDDMIRRARQRSIDDPGLEFQLIGVEEMGHLGFFDTVVSICMFHYARTVNELATMWKHAYEHVAPGGRFVAIMVDSRYDPDGPDLSQYGIIITCEQSRADGVEVHQTFVDGDRQVASVVYRHWERDTHQRLAIEAGFAGLTWVPLAADPQFTAQQPPGFFDDYLANPHLVMVTATREATDNPNAVGGAIYDDQTFFENYQKFRVAGDGSNEILEQPAMHALLPDLYGRDILDIGCGTGDLARLCAERRARTVIAVDPSACMIDQAAQRTPSGLPVRYVCTAIEDLRLHYGSLDVVVSSLALHYIADYPALLANLHTWLRPGGVLLFSTEHPIHSAAYDQGSCADPRGGWHWKLADYGSEGPRDRHWLGARVRKHHRRLETILTGLIRAGFALDTVAEPQPDPDDTSRDTRLRIYHHRPYLLVVRATRDNT